LDPFSAIMYAVVIGVGVPAAFRSPVALTLLVWWLLGMAVWLVYGTVPKEAAVALDVVAFAAIIGLAFQPWFTVTWSTVLVASLFAPSIYAHLHLDKDGDWLVSWVIGNAQFLIAGGAVLAAAYYRIRSWLRELQADRGASACWAAQ